MATRLVPVISFGILAVGCTPLRVYQKCGWSGCPGDTGIAQAVRSKLDQHDALRAPSLIYVKCLDRVVYLSGWVDTDMQRRLAQAIAVETDGVARVVNSVGLSGNR